MNHKYDKDILKRLQSTQLSILKDFVEVCNRNNLKYFLVFGTSIGAERHNGFIPWDDDIDVGMLREDYEKFVKIANKELNEKYRILTPKVDENYACTVTHLQKRNTKFVSYNSKNLKCDLCIDIDIFIFDNIYDNEKERNTQLRKTWFLGRLLFLRGTPNPVISFKGVKGWVMRMACKSVNYILKVIGISTTQIYERFIKVSTECNNVKTTSVTTFEDPAAHKCIMKIDDIFPLKQIDFEGLRVNVPNNNHKILNKFYGNFMEIPLEEDRVNHCPYILDFGEGDVINERNV